MFTSKDIVTVVEIGTSKVVALIGTTDEAGDVLVLGVGQRDLNLATTAGSAGDVSKGEIINMANVSMAVYDAIHEAELKGGYSVDPKKIFVGVTGTHIRSTQGRGVAHIRTVDRKVSEENISQAIEGALHINLQTNLKVIDSFDSYFLLDDDQRRVPNPAGLIANKLEAIVHIIYGDTNRIDTTRAALQETGYDRDVDPRFTAVAASYGVLTEQEKESGVLMIDIGAGTTEFIMIENSCIQTSGVLPIGTEHIANDLQVAFNISIEDARKVMACKDLFAQGQSKQAVLTLSSKSRNNKPHQIPVHSIEKVIDMRVRELLILVQERVEEGLHHTGRRIPVVLTGGVALIPYMVDIVTRIFDAPVRVGIPQGITGMVSSILSPRYAMIVGLLVYANLIVQDNPNNGNGILAQIDNVPQSAAKFFKKIGNAFRF